ncbi:hypothetical protein NDU88_005045 [Pleurodeles waltl]|uniref:Uncharacterized protein n=1 Tax=Pleurodeles waltl TaxID=8319 RepID=A0AAV7WAQ2_PLEWA|nr:hypothetical protein NDU88_005045 [Pleurodeles waltl]
MGASGIVFHESTPKDARDAVRCAWCRGTIIWEGMACLLSHKEHVSTIETRQLHYQGQFTKVDSSMGKNVLQTVWIQKGNAFYKGKRWGEHGGCLQRSALKHLLVPRHQAHRTASLASLGVDS